jgi:hypothetical protein
MLYHKINYQTNSIIRNFLKILKMNKFFSNNKHIILTIWNNLLK